MSIIEVHNISKRFIISHEIPERYTSIRDAVSRKAKKFLYKSDRTLTAEFRREEFWALKDISFNVESGDRVGIIGRNGAGKSTLLKIMSRITDPTSGVIRIKGRVASLLEVGTGFHPELTGRENIFLNGAILGMGRSEIKRRFDEIVDFAEVEKFLDTPVKHFSSGMYVRLAFAIAAHLDPDILILDEVLAVGDMRFQKKCMGKMQQVSNTEGRTVLFVSHNMESVLRFCNKGVYLENGAVSYSGEIANAIDCYLAKANLLPPSISYSDILRAPGNEKIRLRHVSVINEAGENNRIYNIDQRIGIQMEFEVLEPSGDLVMGFNLFNQSDVHILTSHDISSSGRFFRKGRYRSTVWIEANFLSEGDYYCGIAAMSYEPFVIHYHDVNKFNFTVIDQGGMGTARGPYLGHLPGVVRPKLVWDATYEE